MPLEPNVLYISDLNPLWPTSGDPKQRGDDHIREIKSSVLNTFPLVKGIVPIAHDQFASKDFVISTAFSTALPGQPNDGQSYRLVTVNRMAGWKSESLFDDDDRLAEAHAVALSF